MSNDLYNFLTRNNINKEKLDDVIYQAFILSIFEKVCEYLSYENNQDAFLSRLRKTNKEVIEIEQLIKQHMKIKLSAKEANYMKNLIYAYLGKGTSRKVYTKDEKKRILNKQHSKCNICGVFISINNSHLDHIIPWKLVGDELENNLQILCESCNLSKNASVVYLFKVFLEKGR